MQKEEIKLNENDNKLLEFCRGQERSVNEIAKYLSISPSSVVFKLKKLNLLLDIDKQGTGKKTFVRTRQGDKSKEYMKEVLKILQNRKGQMSFRDFNNIYPNEVLFEKEGRDKVRASRMVLYSGMVEHIIKITPEGLKFLEEKEVNKGK